MGARLTVFGWHNVEPTWCFPNRTSGVRGLEAQLRKLRTVANVVPLGSALDALRAGEPLPPRAVALCWDDGYRDNLDLAVPILERLGLPGTFFLVPSLLSGQRCAWWEVAGWAFARATRETADWQGLRVKTGGPEGKVSYRHASDRLRGMTAAHRHDALEDLVERLAPDGAPGDEKLFLDWTGARELVARGFEVGSHTMSHFTMAKESAEDQARDLKESRAMLESELGQEIRLVAYPFGQPDAVSETTQQATRDAGYAYGLTTQSGSNSCTTNPTGAHRIMLDPAAGFVATAWGRVRNKLRPTPAPVAVPSSLGS